MCIYGNCALWGCLFWSCILEEIGILKGDQKGVKDWMTLTVTHWLLHHRVTVEFRGSMGKFVQLSTQIRTYRNCRGEVVVGGFMCVSHSINSCYCAGEYLGLEEKLLPAYSTGLSWFLLLNRPHLDPSPFILCQSFCRVGHQAQLLS